MVLTKIAIDEISKGYDGAIIEIRVSGDPKGIEAAIKLNNLELWETKQDGGVTVFRIETIEEVNAADVKASLEQVAPGRVEVNQFFRLVIYAQQQSRTEFGYKSEDEANEIKAVFDQQKDTLYVEKYLSGSDSYVQLFIKANTFNEAYERASDVLIRAKAPRGMKGGKEVPSSYKYNLGGLEKEEGKRYQKEFDDGIDKYQAELTTLQDLLTGEDRAAAEVKIQEVQQLRTDLTELANKVLHEYSVNLCEKHGYDSPEKLFRAYNKGYKVTLPEETKKLTDEEQLEQQEQQEALMDRSLQQTNKEMGLAHAYDLSSKQHFTKVAKDRFQVYDGNTHTAEIVDKVGLGDFLTKLRGGIAPNAEFYNRLISLPTSHSIVITTSALNISKSAKQMGIEPWKIVKHNGQEYFVSNVTGCEYAEEDEVNKQAGAKGGLNKTASAETKLYRVAVTTMDFGQTITANQTLTAMAGADKNNVGFTFLDPNHIVVDISSAKGMKDIHTDVQEALAKANVHLPDANVEVSDVSKEGTTMGPGSKVYVDQGTGEVKTEKDLGLDPTQQDTNKQPQQITMQDGRQLKQQTLASLTKVFDKKAEVELTAENKNVFFAAYTSGAVAKVAFVGNNNYSFDLVGHRFTVAGDKATMVRKAAITKTAYAEVECCDASSIDRCVYAFDFTNATLSNVNIPVNVSSSTKVNIAVGNISVVKNGTEQFVASGSINNLSLYDTNLSQKGITGIGFLTGLAFEPAAFKETQRDFKVGDEIRPQVMISIASKEGVPLGEYLTQTYVIVDKIDMVTPEQILQNSFGA